MRKVIPLTETHPELCKEWDYEKNDVKPSEISHGSTKEVWWKCKYGHSFSRTPNQRTNPRGKDVPEGFYTECPHCSHAVATPGEYSFATEHPELMEEWDWEANQLDGINPDNILPHSAKKVHWVCKENPLHKWAASPGNRVSGGRKNQGSGCPYCDGKAFKEGITDLETLYPNIAAEWDYERNEDTPNHVHAGSTKSVHWICPKGHHYEMSPSRRTRQGQGCSVCAGKKVIYETSLAYLYPEVAAEWDYERNILTPDQVAPKSSRKAWWICSKNPKHRYEAVIASRTFRGTGCPFCSGFQVLPEESLGTLYPALLAEWDYEKNRNLDPFSVTPGSSQKAWWKCEKGHSWYTAIDVRTSGHGCAECQKGTRTSFTEQLFFLACCQLFPEYEVINRYITSFGDEIDVYIPHLSLGIEPGNWVLHKKKYEKDLAKRERCMEHGIRIITIYDEYKEPYEPFEDDCFTEEKFFGNGQNYLFIRNILKEILNDESIDEKFWDDNVWKELAFLARREANRPVNDASRSLAEVAPDIASEWHPTLNGDLTPKNVYAKSKQIAYWVCPKGHEYRAPICDRVMDGRGCGICSKRTVDARYNTISKLYPEFVDMMSNEDNDVTADEVTPFSSKKLTWVCPYCGRKFVRTAWTMFRSACTKCPHCRETFPHIPLGEIDF